MKEMKYKCIIDRRFYNRMKIVLLLIFYYMSCVSSYVKNLLYLISWDFYRRIMIKLQEL